MFVISRSRLPLPFLISNESVPDEADGTELGGVMDDADTLRGVLHA